MVVEQRPLDLNHPPNQLPTPALLLHVIPASPDLHSRASVQLELLDQPTLPPPNECRNAHSPRRGLRMPQATE